MERLLRFIKRLREVWKSGGFRGVWSLINSRYVVRLYETWAQWWMRHASLSRFGKIATRVALLVPLPYLEYYEQQGLARLSRFGFVAPSAMLHHSDVRLGPHVFISERVDFQEDAGGGPITLDERVWIGSQSLLRTGQGGSITIGRLSSIGINCELSAYVADIRIGSHVMIASGCRFFPYDHGTELGRFMQEQTLTTKGHIYIEDDVWMGSGAIVLSGVRIGKGAVVAA